MSEFVPVASVSELEDGQKLLVEADDRLVLLFRVGADYYCLDDVCTHDGGPLSDGPIDAQAAAIACPRHGARFDMRTGDALTMPATKPTVAHEVKVEGDQVLVRLNSAS